MRAGHAQSRSMRRRPDSAVSTAHHAGCMRGSNPTHPAHAAFATGIAFEPHRIPLTHANATE
ncbi:hypothetical protein WJ62_08115 [Burkholderia diffusa]|nr:hypothetical protein WJ62_08115 [Burkholderia diffusa]